MINYRLIFTLIGVILVVTVVYPVSLWLVTDIGFGLALGIGRAYVLWLGFVLTFALVAAIIYYIQPADKEPKAPEKQRVQWRQS